MAVTVPARWVTMSWYAFMASTTAMVWPLLSSSPTLTLISVSTTEPEKVEQIGICLPVAAGAGEIGAAAGAAAPAPSTLSRVTTKHRVFPPSTTVHLVVRGMSLETASGGMGLAIASFSGAAFFLSGTSILHFPQRSRIPSFSSIFFPGTIAETTRKTFLSVTARFASSRAFLASGMASGTASNGSPSKGGSFSCSDAVLTTTVSGGSGVLPKYPSTARP